MFYIYIEQFPSLPTNAGLEGVAQIEGCDKVQMTSLRLKWTWNKTGKGTLKSASKDDINSSQIKYRIECDWGKKTWAPVEDTIEDVKKGGQCVVTDLDPNTAYSFRILAFNDFGESAWSKEYSCRTAQATIPRPQVSISKVTANSFDISWPKLSSPKGELRYRIETDLKGKWSEVEKTEILDAGSHLSATICKLESGISFRVRVVVFGSGSEIPSKEAGVTTIGTPKGNLFLNASLPT